MRIITESLSDTATLTGYLLDDAPTTHAEPGSAPARPAVLVLPGGGYTEIAPREAEPIAMAYLAQGFNAFVLRYAVGLAEPGEDSVFEASLADATAAMMRLRDGADELGIDPHAIACAGFSAGGHLALALGTITETTPDALVLGYPVTMSQMGRAMGVPIPDLVGAVNDNTPPTFVFATCGDPMVPVRNSIELLSELDAHLVPFESHIYLLGGHGISLATPVSAGGQGHNVEPAVAEWLTDSVRFLHTVFGDAYSAAHMTSDTPSYDALLQRRRIGIHMPLRNLLADERATTVLSTAAPTLALAIQDGELPLLASPAQIAWQTPAVLDRDTLDRLQVLLDELN